LAIVILHYMYFSFSSNSDKNLRLVAENPMSKKRVSKKEYKSNTE
jgi:hypothetical protein